VSKEVYEWFRVAAQNNFPFADGGMPEGMDRQQVNDSDRERMRAFAEFYDTHTTSTVGMEFLDLMRNPTDRTAFTVTRLSATVIRIASGVNDMSAYFNTDRRIQTYTAGAITDSLFVLSVSYSNPNTDVTIYSVDGSEVTAGIDAVKLHVAATIGRLAFTDTVTLPFVIPAGLTDSEFDAALAAIDAAGGGILLLLGGTHLLTSQKTIDHPVWILGRGRNYSTIKCDDESNLESIFKLSTINSKYVRFSNFTLDGNRANQSSGVGDGILIDSRATLATFEDLEVISTRRHGLYLNNNSVTSDVFDIRMAKLDFRDTGGDGIGSADPQSSMFAIKASQITVENPGQEQTESAGIRVAGKWKLSDIDVFGLDLGGGNTQRGIWFLERLGLDPNPQDARLCSLSGFTISGTGGNTRGIECHGERIAISAGAISVSGAVSRGVLMGGTLGQQSPQFNSLNGVIIEDANIGVLLESTCTKVSIGSGVQTTSCTTGINVQGDNCDVRGARVEGGGTGLKVGLVAVGVVVDNVYFDSVVGDAIDVASGALETQITGNTFRTITGDDIVDAGTNTVVNGNHPQVDIVQTVVTSGNQTISGRDPISGLTALPFPGLGANGQRQFKVSALCEGTLGVQNPQDQAGLRLEICMGPLGTIVDPVFAAISGHDRGETSGDTMIFPLSIPVTLLTPDAGDTISLAMAEFGAAAGSEAVKTATDPAYCIIEKVSD
jgi:hypothetical protein